MRASLDSASATLRIDFDNGEALRSFAGDWRRKEGCLVRLGEQLKLWTELTVELRQAGAARLSVAARVVQVFGGGASGFAIALEATSPEALDEPRSDQPRPAAAGAGGPAGDDGEPPASANKDAANPEQESRPSAAGGEMHGASPAFRIRRMNVSEKIRFATKASRAERQILLRDGSPQVLMGLLANPRIEDKEVLALAKNPSASSGVLQRIAKDRRWSTNYEVRLALVRNPQTPTPLALKMLDTLREGDLRVLAKGSMVREAIRGAALRKVIKR